MWSTVQPIKVYEEEELVETKSQLKTGKTKFSYEYRQVLGSINKAILHKTDISCGLNGRNQQSENRTLFN